ncbi:MAG TPA: preprotein translocase subunit SecE [Gaiellaceae bacterium]|nr:preprotein translocase subunit SecE [Gaiellaceae bacterium]HUJ55695.1 preprotein translocase subunit SecE [Gaiellaceae bacterium]
MARQTRQQRRQRRAQAAGTPPRRPPTPPAPTDGTPEPEPRQPAPRRAPLEEPGGGIPGVRFVQEAVAELRKVEWPNQPQVVSGTAVVLVACLIVGFYLWANDELWRYVVQHVLLH